MKPIKLKPIAREAEAMPFTLNTLADVILWLGPYFVALTNGHPINVDGQEVSWEDKSEGGEGLADAILAFIDPVKEIYSIAPLNTWLIMNEDGIAVMYEDEMLERYIPQKPGASQAEPDEDEETEDDEEYEEEAMDESVEEEPEPSETEYVEEEYEESEDEPEQHDQNNALAEALGRLRARQQPPQNEFVAPEYTEPEEEAYQDEEEYEPAPAAPRPTVPREKSRFRTASGKDVYI